MGARIVSDGTADGTCVVDPATGEKFQFRPIEFEVLCAYVRVAVRRGRRKANAKRQTDSAMEAIVKENDKKRYGIVCPECGGTGEVQLFTSTVPCSRGCKK